MDGFLVVFFFLNQERFYKQKKGKIYIQFYDEDISIIFGKCKKFSQGYKLSQISWDFILKYFSSFLIHMILLIKFIKNNYLTYNA